MAFDIYERVASEKKAHIIFTAHLGNFEMIPMAGETYGLRRHRDVPAAEQSLHRRIHPLDAPGARWAA